MPFHFHRIFRSIVGKPLHAFIRRLRLEMAVFQMLHGPKATPTAVALRSGIASSFDFSRAFKQTYGFSPRGFSRDRFLQESKIRQDLLANAWLPRSGYEPTGDPTMEVYRRSPVELGWETFDNDCCLPVRPLRRR